MKGLKKIFLFATLALSMAFVACSSKTDEEKCNDGDFAACGRVMEKAFNDMGNELDKALNDLGKDLDKEVDKALKDLDNALNSL